MLVSAWAYGQDSCGIDPSLLTQISNTWKQQHAQSRYRLTSETVGVDTIDIAVLLVAFADAPKPTNALRPNGFLRQDIDSMYFARGTGWTGTTQHFNGDSVYGSMAQFYSEMTLGHVYIRGKVLNPVDGNGAYVWVTMPNNASTYGISQSSTSLFFRKADTLGYWDGDDGHYESFALLQSGLTFPANPGLETIVAMEMDGRTIVGEWFQAFTFTTSFGPTHIGTHAHEFGHALFGWWDMYDATLQRPEPGHYDLMARGNQNGSTNFNYSCPAFTSPFNRIEAGWITPNIFYATTTGITIPYSYNSPIYWQNKVNPYGIYQRVVGDTLVNPNYSTDTSEYIIVEENLRQGFNKYTPNSPDNFASQSGQLLIWRSYINSEGTSLIARTDSLGFYPRTGTRATYTRGSFSLKGIRKVGATTVIDTVVSTLTQREVFTDSANNIQTTSARLYGHVNITGTLTGVGFIWDNDRAFTSGDSLLASESPINAFSIVHRDITGLPSGSRIFYKVIACNSLSGRIEGNVDSLTTQSTATKPTVITSTATSVTNATATANGSVNPNGASTTVTIKLFDASSVFISSATVATLTGTTLQAVSRSLTSLSGSTTYGYKVYASNSAGSDSGSMVFFTTQANPAAAPTVTTNAITNLGLSSPTPYSTATLLYSCNVTANGGVTTVRFVWGTTTGVYTDSTTVSTTLNGSTSTNFTYSATGLKLNTDYFVRARADNSAGNVQGSQVTATTSAALPVLTTNSASNITQTSATVSGTLHTGGAATLDSFLVWSAFNDTLRKKSTQSPVSGGQSALTVSVTFDSLQADRLYYFRHKAKHTSISPTTTVVGGDSSFRTSTASGLIPTVTLGTPLSLSPTSERISGSVNANNLSTLVRFWYLAPIGNVGFDTVFTTYGTITGTNAVSVSKDLTGLRDSYTYTYGIRATNTQGGVDAVSTFTTSTIHLGGRFVITK